MELFAHPPVAGMEPEAWSTGASQREGAFGGWAEVHGRPSGTNKPVAFPFEMHCGCFWRSISTRPSAGAAVDIHCQLEWADRTALAPVRRWTFTSVQPGQGRTNLDMPWPIRRRFP
jgi:hypothetical protein